MPKKHSAVVGIDVGSQQIKVAELRAQGNTPVITALGSAPTPPGAVDHTGLYDADAAADRLKALFAECGVTVPMVVMSIAGQSSVLVRTLEVPRMNPAELKEHMKWESTRNSPFAEDIVSDFRAFDPEDPQATNLDVVMALAPESAAQTILNTIKKAGKRPLAIDVQPLALARLVEVAYGSELRDMTVCVVDMGAKSMSINMYRNGRLLMPRVVPIGSDMFTQEIERGLGVSAEEAERIKQERLAIPESASAAVTDPFAATQGFTPYNPFAEVDPALQNPALAVPWLESPGAEESTVPVPAEEPPKPVPAEDQETIRLYNTVAGVVEELVAEVRRSVEYFRGKGGDVHRLLLCGGGSQIRGLPAFLNRSLGISCEVLDPMRSITVSAKKLDPSIQERHRPEFAVAIGNGLHIFFD